MSSGLKISVITPSLNAGRFIEENIISVLDQKYENFEHIVVDGGSTDNTIDILKQYPHLKWISQPDSGQPEAMNKGFNLSNGDIIVYLNSDDYFIDGAFHAVIPHFMEGADFVQGRIRVVNKNGRVWINDGSCDHKQILRHWEPQAFCINPVGYFYRREVQSAVGGFNEKNHYAMDLEFLLNASQKYTFIKINAVLGVFRYFEYTKTYRRQINGEVFTKSNFWFIEKFLADMPDDYVKKYRIDQESGYTERNRLLQNNNVSKPL